MTTRQRQRRISRGWRWLALAVVLANSACAQKAVWAQSLTAAGGTSTFLDASGFQVDYKWQPVSGWAGLGLTQGTHVGGFVGTTYHGFDLGLGDRYFPFLLDTDVLDQSYLFYGRGVSIGRRTDTEQWMLFAGTSALPYATPFLRAYKTGTATGALFFDRRLSPRIVFHSRSIFGDQTTSIQSLGVTIDPHWKVAAAGGVGANTGFFSAATDFEHKWARVTGSYTENNDRFRRFQIAGLPYSERTGGNVRVQLTPLSALHVQLEHNTVLSPILGSEHSLRTWLNSGTASTFVKGFSLSGTASESRGGQFFTSTRTLTGSRSLGERLRAFGAFLRIRTQGSMPANLVLLTSEESLSRRFSVHETFTHGPGTRTLGGGAQFLSNPVTLGIDYQTVFSPLAGAFNGRAFVQAWMVSARIQAPKGIGLNYQTFIDPFGRYRYTAFLNGISYNPTALNLGAAPRSPVTMNRYLIRGLVRDERGRPVWGIAVQIDSEFVYSDSSGQFYIRVPHRAEYPIKVASERSLAPGPWALVSAPTKVSSELPTKARPIAIVVRRVRRGI